MSCARGSSAVRKCKRRASRSCPPPRRRLIRFGAVESPGGGRMQRATLVLLVSLLPALPSPLAAASGKPDPVAAFDRLAAQARADWEVPGMAVAVVHEGRVLLAKGYGVRELGRPAAVDADTLFAAASTTKAMTAAAIGMLVDEGKLEWDDPVRKFVPELRLADPALADSLTVRDLLTHHTGLP